MSGNDFKDWYKSIPQITRYWFTGSVVLPLVARFGIISAQSLVLFFHCFLKNFIFGVRSPRYFSIQYRLRPDFLT